MKVSISVVAFALLMMALLAASCGAGITDDFGEKSNEPPAAGDTSGEGEGTGPENGKAEGEGILPAEGEGDNGPDGGEPTNADGGAVPAEGEGTSEGEGEPLEGEGVIGEGEGEPAEGEGAPGEGEGEGSPLPEDLCGIEPDPAYPCSAPFICQHCCDEGDQVCGDACDAKYMTPECGACSQTFRQCGVDAGCLITDPVTGEPNLDMTCALTACQAEFNACVGEQAFPGFPPVTQCLAQQETCFQPEPDSTVAICLPADFDNNNPGVGHAPNSRGGPCEWGSTDCPPDTGCIGDESTWTYGLCLALCPLADAINRFEPQPPEWPADCSDVDPGINVSGKWDLSLHYTQNTCDPGAPVDTLDSITIEQLGSCFRSVSENSASLGRLDAAGAFQIIGQLYDQFGNVTAIQEISGTTDGVLLSGAFTTTGTAVWNNCLMEGTFTGQRSAAP